MSHLIVALAFATGFLLVFAVNLIVADILGRRRGQILQRLQKELRQQQRERVRAEIMQNKDLARLAAEGHSELLRKERWTVRLAKWLEQSGTGIKPLTVLVLALLAGMVPAAGAWLLLGTVVAGVPVFLVGAAVPVLYVSFRRKQRCDRLLAQLPDAFELMSRMMRAGQTIPQALLGVADEFEDPIATEFGYCYEQQNLGLTAESAMKDLAQRTGLLELRIFVVAVSVHRQTGGNLSELLDNLSSVIRDRQRIRGQIRALTAEGRLQAGILLGLPPFLMGVLTVVNQEYIATLFQYPLLLVGMFVFEIIGALWLRMIINFDF